MTRIVNKKIHRAEPSRKATAAAINANKAVKGPVAASKTTPKSRAAAAVGVKKSKKLVIAAAAQQQPPSPPSSPPAAAADPVAAGAGAGEKKQRKKHRYHPGTVALRVIRALQKSTSFMLASAPLRRMIRELAQDHRPDSFFAKESLIALQEAGESFMHDTFADAAKMMLHRKAVTLNARDFRMAVHMSDTHAPPGQAGRELLSYLPTLSGIAPRKTV